MVPSCPPVQRFDRRLEAEVGEVLLAYKVWTECGNLLHICYTGNEKRWEFGVFHGTHVKEESTEFCINGDGWLNN